MAVAGFLLALVLVLYFAGSVMREMRGFHDAQHEGRPLEGWMTPRYVSMSYRVPPEEILALWQISPDIRRRMTLSEISKLNGMTIDQMQRLVTERARVLRAGGQ